MKYVDGTEVRLWDRVEVWPGNFGVVVIVFDSGQFAPWFKPEHWEDEIGVMFDSKDAGLVQHEELDEDTVLLERGAPFAEADLKQLLEDLRAKPC